jgi:hypothetical protein
VIGHEAVRKKFRLAYKDSLQNLRTHKRDLLPLLEVPLTAMRANRQEIKARTNVSLRIETEWASHACGDRKNRARPRIRKMEPPVFRPADDTSRPV